MMYIPFLNSGFSAQSGAPGGGDNFDGLPDTILSMRSGVNVDAFFAAVSAAASSFRIRSLSSEKKLKRKLSVHVKHTHEN